MYKRDKLARNRIAHINKIENNIGVINVRSPEIEFVDNPKRHKEVESEIKNLKKAGSVILN